MTAVIGAPALRALLAWAIAGALLSAALHLTGLALTEFRPFDHPALALWLSARALLDPVHVFGVGWDMQSASRFWPRLLLTTLNAAFYLSVGASVIAARRWSPWFYAATMVLTAPSIIMFGYLFYHLVLDP